jgi:Trypsin
MPRRIAFGLTLFLPVLAGSPAHAVVLGSSSSLGSYTVRLVGSSNCSGVAVARRAVVTAAHCARGMHVATDAGAFKVAGISRSAVLDDGRRVHVSGDAAILRMAADLAGVSAAPIGDGGGGAFTIAGYGTTDERARGAFGTLHEASLVAAGSRALVDPNRAGRIGASACFGDSGGPVMRGGMLVGVITRAAHPSPRIACGDLTRWAAIRVSGAPAVRTEIAARSAVDEPKPKRHRRHARKSRDTEQANLFGNWFAPEPEPRRKARRKSARR